MTALAVFTVALAVGTYLGLGYRETSRDIDNRVRRFLAEVDRERR